MEFRLKFKIRSVFSKIEILRNEVNIKIICKRLDFIFFHQRLSTKQQKKTVKMFNIFVYLFIYCIKMKNHEEKFLFFLLQIIFDNLFPHQGNR